MINIVLCGGSGTRLWPLSRAEYPKQFYKLFGDRSLFQETVTRNKTICTYPFVVSNEKQYFLAEDQLNEIKIDQYKFLLEPLGRNTAPAIALACYCLDPDDVVLVTPSDHFIDSTETYQDVLEEAKQVAEKGYLVTFGIKPSYPESGFGYIEFDGSNVLSFREKPDLATAKQYVESKKYYWNSGMFVFKVKTFLDELATHSPEVFLTARTAVKNAKKNTLLRINAEDMANFPDISIDYAVMEKSNKVKMLPINIGWSDLGSFEALDDRLQKDINGNTGFISNIHINSQNNMIISEGRMIATIDIENLVIVDTKDALLIAKKGSSQKVKEVVSLLKERSSNLINTHITTYKPWGNRVVLEETLNYKINKVTIKPGCSLKRQKHFHRNEHWIVISGTATVTKNQTQIILKVNESTFVRKGEEHKISNNGDTDLVFIEVQAGDVLGDSDILTLEEGERA